MVCGSASSADDAAAGVVFALEMALAFVFALELALASPAVPRPSGVAPLGVAVEDDAMLDWQYLGFKIALRRR